MFDILFARTFVIVGGMLLITAATARINKAFETKKELILTVIATFALLFAIMFLRDSFPLNIALVAAFSAIVGWEIGPTIEYYGRIPKIKKFNKQKGLEPNHPLTPEMKKEFNEWLKSYPDSGSWNKIVSQALFSTALAVFATAGTVFLTSFDFSFLGGFLFIALIVLIIMGLLNMFFFKSSTFSLVRAFFGVLIFTGYLLYDFNRLEKMAGDESWATAIDISVSLYLDIINLFLDLLEIFAALSD